MTLKKSIVKYICYKVNKIITTDRVYVMFQYFPIYFNNIIQDTIPIAKAASNGLLV